LEPTPRFELGTADTKSGQDRSRQEQVREMTVAPLSLCA
jgi:hypothetical protein